MIKNNVHVKKSPFFLVMGLVGLFAILAGFAKTFIVPVASGGFKAPLSIYFHGAFSAGWVVLFFVQTWLIRKRNDRLHKSLGFAGIFVALGASITTLPVGVYMVQNELHEGLGETAVSGIVGIVTSHLIFLSLVFAGIINRTNRETHKRLMLLATIVILWPAWFRFRHYFPSVPRPDIWFAVILADSLIIISWIWDRVTNGRIHPVLLYVGTFILAENIFEVIMFDTPVWRTIAKPIYHFLSA